MYNFLFFRFFNIIYKLYFSKIMMMIIIIIIIILIIILDKLQGE